MCEQTAVEGPMGLKDTLQLHDAQKSCAIILRNHNDTRERK